MGIGELTKALPQIMEATNRTTEGLILIGQKLDRLIELQEQTLILLGAVVPKPAVVRKVG